MYTPGFHQSKLSFGTGQRKAFQEKIDAISSVDDANKIQEELIRYIPDDNVTCSDDLLKITIQNLYKASYRPDRPQYLLEAVKNSKLSSSMKDTIQQFINSPTQTSSLELRK